MIYLLAYPRSGSSFFRYLLGFLTESKPMQPDGHCELDNLLKDYYKKEPYIKKFHKPVESFTHMIQQNGNDKLVLLLRDPVENMLSFALSNENLNKKNFSDSFINNFVNKEFNNGSFVFHRYTKSFLENINFYKNWQGEKTVVNYENLMTDIENELLKHCDFFGYSKERVDLLMSDIEYHRNLMLKEKTKNTDPFSVNTKGKDLNKFKNTLNEDNLLYLEKMVSNNVGEL